MYSIDPHILGNAADVSELGMKDVERPVNKFERIQPFRVLCQQTIAEQDRKGRNKVLANQIFQSSKRLGMERKNRGYFRSSVVHRSHRMEAEGALRMTF